MPLADIRKVQVIAPNFKRRLSGVTSTIIQLLPVQSRQGVQIAALGPGLPDTLPHIRFRDLVHLWSAPEGAPVRIWHARRNLEMLPAIVMRDMLRMKIRVVFTSASQRKHSGWTRFLISQMDAVVATSAKTAGYLTVPNTVVMHGIDAARFEPAADKAAAKTNVGLIPQRNYVGCFGRVRHQKGTDLFVDAMIALLPHHTEWSAVIAGRATAKHVEFENGLKKKVRDAGLADRILFVGEHTNINEWHRAMDLFVAPQRWEGFGLTPLEAMASGVPVVATDVGAFGEMLPAKADETGELIPRDDLVAMTVAVGEWISDTPRRTAAGIRARAHALTRFTISGEANRLDEIYKNLAQNPTPHDVIIIGKDSKFGLTKDIELLVEGLRSSEHELRIGTAGIRARTLYERLFRRRRATLAIHNERIYPRWYSSASQHVVVPNQERFPHRHLGRLKKVSSVWAKSRHAQEIFAGYGATTDYLGFTSEDRRDLDVARNWDAFLHLAGGSTLKGTEDILALWAKHPEWPELLLIQNKHLAPETVPANVRVISHYLDDASLKAIQNSTGIHLCPSRAEGWGHHMVESMSVGALIIATDAPPMNEHVSPESAIMVPYARTEPRRIGTCFFVDPAALEAAVERAIAMSEQEKAELGNAARRRFEEIRKDFAPTLTRLVNEKLP